MFYDEFPTGQGPTGPSPEVQAWAAQVEALLLSAPKWMNPTENKTKALALQQCRMARLVSTEATRKIVGIWQAANPDEPMLVDLQGALSLLAIGIDLGQKMMVDQALGALDTEKTQ